jgi:hypothetical protein
MKLSNHFTQAIKSHLDKVAIADLVFADKYSNPDKNIDYCCQYILTCVHKSGFNGFEDSEVFEIAMEYYLSDSELEIDDKLEAKCVTNYHVELTDEEINEAKEAAKQKIINEAMAVAKRGNKPNVNANTEPSQTQQPSQASLF